MRGGGGREREGERERERERERASPAPVKRPLTRDHTRQSTSSNETLLLTDALQIIMSSNKRYTSTDGPFSFMHSKQGAIQT